jgi:hypothetical protein
MPDEYRVTVRLSPELYAQLEARGSHGQPLAAIVRQALLEYVARQPETPPAAPDMARMLADVAARVDALQDQVQALTARLDTLAATRQPAAASDRQPAADVAASARQPLADMAVEPSTPPRPPRGRRQLTPRQVRALRDKHLRGVPVPALMEEYSLSRASVFRYLRSSQRREPTP